MWLAALLMALGSLATQAETAREWFRRGVEAQQRGDWAAARQAYEETLKAAPKHAEAMANLGAVLLKLGQAREAAVRLEAASRLRPSVHAIRLLLAGAWFQLGEFPRAQKEIETVVAAEPGNGAARRLYGLILLKQGDLAQGAAQLEKALEGQPQNVELAATLVTTYVARKDLERAQQLLDGPLAGVQTAEAALARAAVAAARGNHLAAVAELDAALSQNPDLPTARSQRGLSHLMLGHMEEARRDFEEELKRNPADYTANANLGWLLLQEKRYAAAGALLQKALELRGADPGLQYLLAQVDAAQDRPAEAARRLEYVVQQRPDFIAGHVLLARMYARLKRPQDVARQQALIRQLTEREQAANLGGAEAYGAGTTAAPPQEPRP
jgi:tetratricopeptide (TPR) repeat protein